MAINWDSAEERAAAIETLGVVEYNRQKKAHDEAQVIEFCAGHALSYVRTRFGRLVRVGNTGAAYRTLDAARTRAWMEPVSADGGAVA